MYVPRAIAAVTAAKNLFLICFFVGWNISFLAR
jgi:hypothetical protein